jgi:Fe-S-cluster containining protein
MMEEAEWQRICARLGYIPLMPLGSPTMHKPGNDAQRALAAQRMQQARRNEPADITCAMLNRQKGTCRVYEVRPAICRIFGAVDTPLMECPHHCTVTPRKWTNEECRAWLKKVHDLCAEYGLEWKGNKEKWIP